MVRKSRFGGIACLCSSPHERRKWRAEVEDQELQDGQQPQPQQQQQQGKPPAPLLITNHGSAVPQAKPVKLQKQVYSPQQSYLKAHRSVGTSFNSSGSGSSPAPVAAAAAAAADDMPPSAFLAGSGAIFRADSDSLSSLPASEAVFGLASRASAPAAAAAAAPVAALTSAASEGAATCKASAVAGVGGGGDVRKGCILRPMPGGSSAPGSRSGSFRRQLAQSRSFPARLPRVAARAAAAAAAAAGKPTAATAPSASATATAASVGAAPQPAGTAPSTSLKRAPSLSSERSYGSSLLYAAFDRHDTRRAFTTDSANADSASSRSAGSGGRAGSGASSCSPSSCGTAGTCVHSASGHSMASQISLPGSLPSVASATAADAAGASPLPCDDGAAGGRGRKAPAVVEEAEGEAAAAAASCGGGAGATAAEAAALAAARGFSEAFLRALATGDARWGSDPALSRLFAEGARMLTHDGQLFAGRTAIIRRLNAGMEQLHKMLGSVPSGAAGGEGGEEAAGGAAATAQQLADKVHHSLEVALVPREGADDAKRKGGLLQRIASLGRRGGAVDGGGAKEPRSRGRAGAGGAGAGAGSGAGSGSIRVVATYQFRYGLRRFRLQDRFAIRDGLIVRLKRTRG